MCVLFAVSGQDVRAADCNPFVKKGQSPFLTVSKLPHLRELFVHLTVKKSHGRTCCLFSYQRQHRTIASASLRRLFAPLLQFEKPEIHTGFLRFPNFELGQKLCLRLLAELRGAALLFSLQGNAFPDKEFFPQYEYREPARQAGMKLLFLNRKTEKLQTLPRTEFG